LFGEKEDGAQDGVAQEEKSSVIKEMAI